MASSELGPAPEDKKGEKDSHNEEKPKAAGPEAIDWSKSSILDDEPSSEPPTDIPGAAERPLRRSRSSLDLSAPSQEERVEDTLTERRPPIYRPRRGPAIPSVSKTSSEEEAEEKRPKTGELDKTKIGLVGGRGVGKTYFFHGVIYRTLDHNQAGAVSYYLDKTAELRRYEKIGDEPQSYDPFDAVRAYQHWQPYVPTTLGQESWYRLGLEYRSGLLGFDRSRIELEFVDGSGEEFQSALNPARRKIWEAAFSNAGIMVFCLPIWAAFPAQDLSPEDEQKRELFLKQFSSVLANYKATRERGLKVRTILALTQADDDKRCSLQDMIERWIKPYIEDEQTYLDQLRSRSGIPRYLANAHIISNYMHEEFSKLRDRLISQIPKRLNFGRGLPWIIPVSAVEGKTLESAEAMRNASPLAQLPANFEAPVPVHVELPLLAALCENQNALM